MMGASTRNMAAMTTSMGSMIGTCGEKRRQTQTESHLVFKKMCVECMSETNPVRPRKLWLLNLEVDKSRQSDGIEKPGSETGKNNEKQR